MLEGAEVSELEEGFPKRLLAVVLEVLVELRQFLVVSLAPFCAVVKADSLQRRIIVGIRI